jgi:hypothetical protein
VLHKILTAVTALAVVASLLAGTAGQAAAVTGYDSAYFGESAFLTLGGGDSGQFAVGFNNTGPTGWLTGSASQVDLAICLPDKTTCNTTSPNAAFAVNWLSSTAYATTSTTYVGPGQTGYFVYNVKVPAGSAPGTYRFNGDLALHGTGAMLHQQGYYQDTQVPAVGAPAKTACAVSPSSIESGSTQTATLTVQVLDAAGNVVTSNNGYSFTLSQSGTTTTISSANPALTVNGVATWTIDAAPSGTTGTDQLSVAGTPGTLAAAVAGCLTTLTLAAPGAPTALSVSLGQTAFPAGTATTTTANATLRDAAGVATTSTSNVTVTFTVNDTTICNFGGVASTTAVITAGQTGTSGSGTTQTLTITGVPGTCTVTASATGLTSGSKSATIAAAGPASKLVITSNTCSSSPTTSQTPSSTCDVVVQVQDAAGNPVFTAGIPIQLALTKTGSTCSATINSATPALTGGAGTTTATAPTGTAGNVDFVLSDALAETCTATATSAGLTTATASVSWTGFGAATQLTLKPAAQTLPGNGVATGTLTACVRDAAGNIITTNSGDSVSLLKISGTFTNIVSANPTTTSSGCASFTIQATTLIGTDTYQAVDTTRSFTSGTATVNTVTP